MWSSRRKGEDYAAPFGGLEDEVASPDLTGPIMDRLGYHPITSRQSRRRRSMMWIGRVATMSAVLAVVAVGVQMQLRQPDPRQPTGPTLHQAFEHDLDLHTRQFSIPIRTIRDLSPVPAPRPAPRQIEPIEEDESNEPRADQRALRAARWG